MNRMTMQKKNGFTLVEMLLVVALIVLLISLLLPALGKGRSMAQRTVCANQMRQWGAGFTLYAADNAKFFPENRDGLHFAWGGPTVQRFWADYLQAYDKDNVQNNMHLLLCPTQKWHRHDTAINSGVTIRVAGYQFLPHRVPATDPSDYAPPTNPDGENWVKKKRIGGHYSNAPIMMDIMQTWGNSWWFNGTTPFASHIKGDGEPHGGNFLFEAGNIDWWNFRDIDIGGRLGSWDVYYAIPLD